MAARSGTKGLVNYKAVPVFRIDSWSIDFGPDTIDVTAFSTGTLTWRSFISGLSQWSGSFSGSWDMDGSTAQKDLQTNVLTPATGTLKLEADKETGGSYSGDVILSQNVSVSVDGKADVSWSFTGNGALTYATTT